MNELSTTRGTDMQEAGRPVDRSTALKRVLFGEMKAFEASLKGARIPPERFMSVIMLAVQANPKLLDCDRQSLVMAARKAAQDGLMCDGREAALVPFQKREKGADGRWSAIDLVQYIPMTYGVRKRILQSGEVISLEVGVVYRREMEEGRFIYDIGMDPPLRFKPSFELLEEEATDDCMVAAYSIARIKNDKGEPYWSVEVMRRFEIEKVQNSSQTGAMRDYKGNAREPKGPWADWKPEMWKKTVLKRHSKMLPQSGDIMASLNADEDAMDERLTERVMTIMATKGAETRSIEAPTDRLPTAAELTGADQRRQQDFDPETGEVRDARGMSMVDEETARKLDAESQPDAGSEERARAEAEAEAQAQASAREFAEARSREAEEREERALAAKAAKTARAAKPAEPTKAPEPAPAEEAEAEADAAPVAQVPLWQQKVDELTGQLKLCTTKAEVIELDKIWLNFREAVLEEDPSVASTIEQLIFRTKRAMAK